MRVRFAIGLRTTRSDCKPCLRHIHSDYWLVSGGTNNIVNKRPSSAATLLGLRTSCIMCQKKKIRFVHSSKVIASCRVRQLVYVTLRHSLLHFTVSCYTLSVPESRSFRTLCVTHECGAVQSHINVGPVHATHISCEQACERRRALQCRRCSGSSIQEAVEVDLSDRQVT